jgi:ABC-type polysaccharide/polyol phosphate transport system ATPase subunit
MSSDVAIRLKNLSKCYHIYEQPRDRLKQMILPRIHRFAGRQVPTYYQEFWALHSLSLDIRRGEAVGIVGRNGGGKSTLLQLICGTLEPTTGSVEVNGRIAALLELGAGFNPEFTGRENIHLNGAILGLTARDLEDSFDSIVAFADIGDHLDQPVKTYSSGMFVRLAFAVQAHLKPDILVIDEALSVGDQFFQAKCYAAIRKMMDEGTTVLFVSHSASTVKALCPRAVLLDRGQLIMDGPASQVLDRYFVLGSATEGSTTRPAPPSAAGTDASASTPLVSFLQPPFARRVSHRVGTGQARFVECVIFGNGRETTVVETGSAICIQAALAVNEDCPYEGEVGLVVSTIEGVELFAINSFFNGQRIPPLKAGERQQLRFEFVCPLSTGARYRVDLGYRMPVQGEYVDKVFAAAGFTVMSQGDRIVPLLFDVPGTVALA